MKAGDKLGPYEGNNIVRKSSVGQKRVDPLL
jgi:hypothetical protein